MARVMVVEDEYDDVQVISKILRHHNIEVVVAANGDECLKMLPEVAPDLVVMDLAMPHMDGWETLVALRTDPGNAHIPVVAVTAYHSAAVEQDSIKAGFDGYFPKPVQTRTFVQYLEHVLNS